MSWDFVRMKKDVNWLAKKFVLGTPMMAGVLAFSSLISGEDITEISLVGIILIVAITPLYGLFVQELISFLTCRYKKEEVEE